MGWEQDMEAKHGTEVGEIDGKVYIVHYDEPVIARSVSREYAANPPGHEENNGWLSAGPIRHYVGWTQQANPRKRTISMPQPC